MQNGRYFQRLEPRTLFAATATISLTRSIDGSNNNASHPTWGSTNAALIRVAPVQYADGISAPGGSTRPSARDISNQLLNAHLAEDIFNQEGMSAFVYAWGQFVDHDMSLTNDASSPAVPFNVAVPEGDLQFDPGFTGAQTLPLNRSQVVPGTGTSTANPAQNPNSVTAFLDASNVYGSDPVRAAALRSFVGGKLKTTADGTEPGYNTAGLPNQSAGGPADSYFLAGDVRANENSELTSIQVLYVREHNRLATMLAGQHPTWTDEQLYQQARRLVIGEIQHITYTEFLPSILSTALPAYTGYKSSVNPQVSNEFSTAAFRFGHSIVGDDVQFFDDDAQTTKDDLKTSETSFAPDQQLDGGTDGLLKYLAAVSAQELDPVVVNSLRNLLFGPPGAGGMDLASLDIQRGRDHGLADFNTVRASLGLPRYTSFSQMVDNPGLALTLQNLYGNVDNVDLFVGGLIEAKPQGAVMGETFQKIIADQFTRTRDGDRFWYQRDLNASDVAYVNSLTLGDIIKLNTSLTNIQDNVFHFDVHVSGQAFNDTNDNGVRDNGEQPLAGVAITLTDDEGTIIDVTRTDSQGNYTLSEIQVGDYTVTATFSGQTPTTPTADTIHVNTDQTFAFDFGARTVTQAPPVKKTPAKTNINNIVSLLSGTLT